MNSSCTQPSERIAADEQQNEENCCLITEQTPAPSKANCPVSGTPSRKVQLRTLQHLVKPEKADSLKNVQYYFCKEPMCEVVYFSNEKVPFFTTDDLAVKVFVKEQDDDVPVCYCFNWTRARIQQEIRETQKSTAAFAIAREIKASNCECDIKNPKGECCLGDVNTLVKEIMMINQ